DHHLVSHVRPRQDSDDARPRRTDRPAVPDLGASGGDARAKRGRPDGADELPDAEFDLHVALHRRRARAVRTPGAPRALLRGRRHLGRASDLEPAVAAPLPLRPARVGVALADVLATAADATRSSAHVCAANIFLTVSIVSASATRLSSR